MRQNTAECWGETVREEIAAQQARIRAEYEQRCRIRAVQASLFDAEPSRPVVNVVRSL